MWIGSGIWRTSVVRDTCYRVGRSFKDLVRRAILCCGSCLSAVSLFHAFINSALKGVNLIELISSG